MLPKDLLTDLEKGDRTMEFLKEEPTATIEDVQSFFLQQALNQSQSPSGMAIRAQSAMQQNTTKGTTNTIGRFVPFQSAFAQTSGMWGSETWR